MTYFWVKIIHFIFRCYQTREGRLHTTPFFRPTTNNVIIYMHYFVRPLLYFIRYCLHSFLKYFTLLFSNFEPRPVVYNGFEYFICFFKKNTLWRYNRHKTVHGHFYFIILQATQNHLLCSLLKMLIHRF